MLWAIQVVCVCYLVRLQKPLCHSIRPCSHPTWLTSQILHTPKQSLLGPPPQFLEHDSGSTQFNQTLNHMLRYTFLYQACHVVHRFSTHNRQRDVSMILSIHKYFKSHDTTEEKDVPKWSSVVEHDLVEDTAQKDSDAEDSKVGSVAEASRTQREASANSSGCKKAGAARDDRPRDHRDDPPKRKSWRAACGKISHWRGDSACEKTKSTDTPARLEGDKTDARDSDHRRCQNFIVCSRHRESTEDEMKAWRRFAT